MYGTLFGIVASLGAALILVGLSFSASVETPADFRFVNGTEPGTLDPQIMTGQPEGRVADAIFEGLARYDARSMQPVPGAAESWEISPDGLTYVFRIREGARWSDGRKLTAHDFAWSWRRLQEPATAGEYAYIQHMIRFAEAFNTYAAKALALDEVSAAVAHFADSHPGGASASDWQAVLGEAGVRAAAKGVQGPRLAGWLAQSEGRLEATTLRAAASALGAEAERLRAAHAQADRRFGIDGGVFARDDRTLVVELSAPTPYFLYLTAFYPFYPVPRWVIEQEGNASDWFLPEKIVSNGPFELESWRVNDRIRLRRSDSYWGRDEVGLASVDVLALENATAALNLYLTGGVDWLPGLYPKELVDPLSQREDFYRGPGMIVYFYRFNVERPPFDDPRVREALNLAIDRELIVREVLRLGQLAATHIVPPGMPGYDAPASKIGFDVERAQALLAEAGHPGGEGLPALGILFNTSESHKQIAEVIADQLRRNLGIRVSAYNQEWQSYLATLRSRDYDMARAGWIGDYQDPNTFLDMWVTDGGNNQTGWSDARYDALIRAAADVEAFARSRDAAQWIAEGYDPDAVGALLSAMLAEQDPALRRVAGEALRMGLLGQAEAILVRDEFPIMPIYFYVVSGLVGPEVDGFYSTLVQADGSPAANLQDRHPLRAIRTARSRSEARP